MIGSKGVKLITKADLPRLKKIYIGIFEYILDECQINNCGTVHLAKAYWPNLKDIRLSKNSIIQAEIRSKSTDYNH